MSVKVSVIVTVHNSEDSLELCLQSVCNQSLKDIEILCIDGGSTDASPGILKKYEQFDKRIRIINDNNTSYGHKINRGVQEAVGEYAAILESDDTMKEEMLEKLYAVAEAYHPDFVDGNYDAIYQVNGNRYAIPIEKYQDKEIYDVLIGEDGRATLLRSATGAIWTGIYRIGFLKENDIKMHESPGAAFQDTSFRFLVGMLAKSSYHTSESVYNYLMDNVNSSIHDQRKIYAISNEYDYLKEELVSRQADEEVWNRYRSWKYSGYFWNTFRLEGEARQQFIQLYKNELQKDISSGYLNKENINASEYKNTFMLLEEEAEFNKKIEECFKRGNLNVKYLTRFLASVQNKELILFGCGVKAQKVLSVLEYANIQLRGICDNSINVQNTKKFGYDVFSVETAVKNYGNSLFVIPEGKYYQQMEEQLLSLGVEKNSICRAVL